MLQRFFIKKKDRVCGYGKSKLLFIKQERCRNVVYRVMPYTEGFCHIFVLLKKTEYCPVLPPMPTSSHIL